ncbi:MAG: glycosyltransferase family 4 protein [Bizionia sp.]|nr:glycosyltransferase family 4 protein [Bizionia sp.]
MKVLQLIDSLEAGGAERMAVNLANGLVSYIDGAFICATRKEGALKTTISKDVGYLFLDRQRTLDFKAVLRLSRYIKSERITIIHAHSSSFFLATLVKLLQPKVKIVWHDHYGNRDKTNLKLKVVLNICALFFSSVICVSKDIQKWLKQHLITQFKITYLPNFAVLIKQDSNDKAILLAGESGKRIICLANLRSEKGHLYLVKAFKSVVEKHPDWTLHLVGNDLKDEYSKKLHNKIKLLHLDQNVFIYGSLSNVNFVLEQCSIAVLTSVYEGLPVSLLEYGLASTPVICTNVGDCSQLIKNKNTGLLIPAKSIDSIATAILFYISHPLERLNYSKRLHNHIKSHFSEESVIAQLLSIYKRTLS